MVEKNSISMVPEQWFSVDLSLLPRVVTFLASALFLRWVKFFRNPHEDRLSLRGCQFQLGPGMAEANFRFLENVVKGKGEAPSFVKSLDDHLNKEDLRHSRRTWVSPKVFVILPSCGEEQEFTGSVSELIKKEKSENASLCVTTERVRADYTIGGRSRVSWLEFIKFRDPEADENLYAVISENRQTGVIRDMVNEPTIQFTADNYSLQAQLYAEKLKNLLAADKECAPLVETIQVSSKQRLSDVFIKRLRQLRYQSRSNNGG